MPIVQTATARIVGLFALSALFGCGSGSASDAAGAAPGPAAGNAPPTSGMVDGACGSAVISAAPSAALCSAGTASVVTVGAARTWTCAGEGGGKTVPCATSQTSTPRASIAANRYDLVASASAGPPSSPVTLVAYPNGNWPSGSITLTASKPGAASVSAGTLTMPGAGNAPLSTTWTPPSEGEWTVRGTNSAHVYDPYGAPYNAFAASSGAALTLAADVTLNDQAVHQFDAPSGSPTGFAIANTNGWGEVWVTISAIGGGTGALYAKLYDALSSGASASPGTGTALHANPVQVHGAVSGAGEVRLLLPAVKDTLTYLDLATDAGMTNRIRLSRRFRVGLVIGISTRSFICGLGRGYGVYGASTPVSVPYDQATFAIATDARYAVGGDTWMRALASGAGLPDNLRPFDEAVPAAGMELARLVSARTGRSVGITGIPATGGGLDAFVNPDGSLMPAFTETVANTARGKFRWFIGGYAGMDNAPETAAGNRARYLALASWIPTKYPACSVIGVSTGDLGWFGADGSRDLGYTRNQMVWLDEIEPTNAMATGLDVLDMFDYANGHATQGGKTGYARELAHKLLTVELSPFGGLQTTQRGPTLATTATIAPGTSVILVPYKLNGATALHANVARVSQSDHATVTYDVDGATGADLATLFAVYPGTGRSGSGVAVAVSSVSIDAKTKPNGYDGVLRVALDPSVTPSRTMTVQALSDFGASGGGAPPAGTMYMINDDVDVFGLGVGRGLRPRLDIAVTMP